MSAKSVEKLSLRQRIALFLARTLENIKIEEHPLQQLFWECTLRCNLHCRHCGSDCKREAGRRDMPKEDFLRVLDGIASRTDPHQVFVIISGGEPLMRPDLEECGREIYRRGFPWGMVTNGFAMTPERFRALRRSGLHTASVSLDGLAEEHNAMRGHKASFERAVRAIRLMAEEPDFVFDVVTCVTKHTIDKLSEIKELLISLGVRSWRLFTVFPVGRGADGDDLQLSPAGLRSLLDFIVATRKEGRIRASYACEGFLGSYEGKVRDHLYNCQAGVSVASVLIDGGISACTSIRANYRQGNIYEDDFWEVWNNRFEKFRNRAWMRRNECADCRWFKDCRGNGMHLRDDEGNLLVCHLKRLLE